MASEAIKHLVESGITACLRENHYEALTDVFSDVMPFLKRIWITGWRELAPEIRRTLIEAKREHGETWNDDVYARMQERFKQGRMGWLMNEIERKVYAYGETRDIKQIYDAMVYMIIFIAQECNEFGKGVILHGLLRNDEKKSCCSGSGCGEDCSRRDIHIGQAEEATFE